MCFSLLNISITHNVIYVDSGVFAYVIDIIKTETEINNQSFCLSPARVIAVEITRGRKATYVALRAPELKNRIDIQQINKLTQLTHITNPKD